MSKSLAAAAWALRITLVIFLAYFLFIRRDIAYFFASIPAVLVSFWVISKEKTLGYRFPPLLDFFLNVNLFMHVGGYGFSLYSLIDGWDKWTHILGGVTTGAIIVAGFIAFSLRFNVPLRPRLIAFAASVGAAGIGTLWEIIEFSIDSLRVFNFSLATTHTTLQWGLTDTMLDMVFNLAGGIFAALAGIAYIKRNHLKKMNSDLAYLVYFWSAKDLIKEASKLQTANFKLRSVGDRQGRP